MFEALQYIELSGEKYPIKCDLIVLENIQKEFGSIEKFEIGLIPWTPMLDKNGKSIIDEETGKTKVRGKIPKVDMVNKALIWMANEGEAIAAEQENRQVKKIDEKHLLRSVDLSLSELADILHDEFARCFQGKNPEAAQNPEMEETKEA